MSDLIEEIQRIQRGITEGLFEIEQKERELELLSVSNPAGWVILGGIALGTVLTIGFDFLYDNNIWGIQDSLDAVGKKIDDFGKQVSETFESVKESVGEAVSSFGKAINLMNWAW